MEAISFSFQLCERFQTISIVPNTWLISLYVICLLHPNPTLPFPSLYALIWKFTNPKICQFLCLGCSLAQTMASVRMCSPVFPHAYAEQRRRWQSEKSASVFVKAFKGNCESFICLKQLKQEWEKHVFE